MQLNPPLWRKRKRERESIWILLLFFFQDFLLLKSSFFLSTPFSLVVLPKLFCKKRDLYSSEPKTRNRFFFFFPHEKFSWRIKKKSRCFSFSLPSLSFFVSEDEGKSLGKKERWEDEIRKERREGWKNYFFHKMWSHNLTWKWQKL